MDEMKKQTEEEMWEEETRLALEETKTINQWSKKKRAEKLMDEPKYIMTVEYGDPNTNVPLRTAMGIFENKEEVEAFRKEYYQDTNHVCTVYPLNIMTGAS